MPAEINLPFADGVYRFRLGLLQCEEIQRTAGDGIGTVYARVLQGRMGGQGEEGHPAYAAYRIQDLRATVKQALIGGGQGRVDKSDVVVTSLRADELVEAYLDPMPLMEQWDLATKILFATVEGYSDDRTEAEARRTPDEDKKKVTG